MVDMNGNSPEIQEIKIEINLDALVGKYLRQLQCLVDVLNISFVGVEKVDESSYSSYTPFFSIFPAQNFRLTRDLAEVEAKRWFLCSTFRDCIEVTHSFLDECFFVCSIFAEYAKGDMKGEDYNKIAQKDMKTFHSLGLPKKLTILSDKFGISTDLRHHVLSINKARACLVHRFGKVTSYDINDGDKLTIKWRAPRLIARSPDDKEEINLDYPGVLVEAGWKVMVLNLDQQKTFQKGEQISLSFDEITKTIFTLMVFATQTVNAIKESNKRFIQST